MQVAIVHNHPIHYKHLLFQELTRSGLDFEVLFLASQSNVRHEAIPLSSDLYKFKIGYQGCYESAPAPVRMRFIWNALVRANPNVAIISGYYALECWVALAWARLHKRPVILWFESNEFDYPRSFAKESLKRLFVSGCHSAHVYGTSNKQYLTKLGMSLERIHDKRAVVDVERFSTDASDKVYSPGTTKHLVYVGRLAAEKNVGMLIRCLHKALDTRTNIGLKMTIIGTGPLENELRAQCVTLGLQSVVDFKGYCPQNTLGSLLRTADCFVLPSIREPWGLVALEAMLCRTPILVSTQCGCAEDLVTDDTGWKFSPWNDGELTDLLLSLPDVSREEITRMGSAAHELARHYSANECAQRVTKSIRECERHVESGGFVHAE